MRISVSVMAHPKRKLQAEDLALQLSNYPFCDVTIIWDELNDEWHTGKRALLGGVVAGSDWHLVIQDDAILTPLFYENIEGAIINVPTKTVISLYTGTVKPFAERVQLAVSKADTATWLEGFLLFWGVGVLIPSDHIQPMLDFVAKRTEQYDTRIGIFYQRNMLPIYYTMPSLVDHDDDMGSLLDHGGTVAPRVAHKLATGLIAWNQEVIAI